MTRPLALLGALACVVATLSCGRPCRAIAVTPVALACDAAAAFEGENHFDDRATFETFLESDECLPDADDAARAEVLESVDFLNDVVFVAVGDRGQTGAAGEVLRCIESRAADVVEVCDDGLRIAFADRVTDATPCPGKWTVAFQLPREEMRAALQD